MIAVVDDAGNQPAVRLDMRFRLKRQFKYSGVGAVVAGAHFYCPLSSVPRLRNAAVEGLAGRLTPPFRQGKHFEIRFERRAGADRRDCYDWKDFHYS